MTNQTIVAYSREMIKKGLKKCARDQQLLFKRMYSHTDLSKDIDKVVDDMPEDKLDWALSQVEQTINN